MNPLPPKDPEGAGREGRRFASNRPKPNRTIRRLVIWYRRNAAVTSLVGTATATASGAASGAVSVAGSMAGAATNVAGSVLQPLVFDPLRRLQQGSQSGATIDDRQRLWVAVDGMGGHAAGEVASQMAVQTLRDYFDSVDREETLQEATLLAGVAQTNQAIFEANQVKASAGLGRMGTTLVMAVVQDLRVAIVHVGDSRVYSYDKRHGLQQLTVDHEVGQREIHRGVEPAIAYARPDAYQLTQALGPRDQEVLRPGLSYHDITEDTLLLLCSDGLSDNDLLEQHEASHIAPLLSSRANLDQGAADLIQLANEKNGHDNITLILVRLKLRPDLNQWAP